MRVIISKKSLENGGFLAEQPREFRANLWKIAVNRGWHVVVEGQHWDGN